MLPYFWACDAFEVLDDGSERVVSIQRFLRGADFGIGGGEDPGDFCFEISLIGIGSGGVFLFDGEGFGKCGGKEFVFGKSVDYFLSAQEDLGIGQFFTGSDLNPFEPKVVDRSLVGGLNLVPDDFEMLE